MALVGCGGQSSGAAPATTPDATPSDGAMADAAARDGAQTPADTGTDGRSATEGGSGQSPDGSCDAPSVPVDSGTDATSSSEGGAMPRPDLEECGGLTLEREVQVAGTTVDQFRWNDADCEPRTASMTREGGGYVRQFQYALPNGTRTATGTGVNGWQGWGFAVSHDLGNGVAQGAAGSFAPVFVGAHHAAYDYQFVFPGSDVDVHMRWTFATGRSNPVVAITYDASRVPADTISADTRTPYGDIAWDGDENFAAGGTVVSGVGWGDRYKFITTSAPLTMNSTWDYTEPNLVPYCLEWTDASDAEMGAVQTQTQAQHAAGGYWNYKNWGRTSENQQRDDGQVGRMPITWNWTYQLNQYELCVDDPNCVDWTTASHRLSWGSNYGAVGQASYPVYGDDQQASGHPYQSYAVFMVLGRHSETPVFDQVRQIEVVQHTALSASVGSVATRGPGGVARSDEVELSPPGWDPVHAAFRTRADQGRLELSACVSDGALENPVLIVEDWTADRAPQVRMDGADLRPDVDFVASVLDERSELWLTFRTGWSGSRSIVIE